MFREGEVLPGVTAIPAPGHTPGHTTYLIESGGTQLLIWADTVHVPEVQTARQEVTVPYDIDPAAAEAPARRVFDTVEPNHAPVTRTHMHLPRIALLRRSARGLSSFAAQWAQ